MITSASANTTSFRVEPLTDEEITITRLFDAPLALVWEVLTRPEHVRRWWGNLGPGYSVPVCEIDLRVGGKWRFVNAFEGGEVTFYGEYREIDPPGHMVHTEIFADFPDAVSVVTTSLTPEDGKTRLRAIVRYPSRLVRDQVLGSGMARGAGLSYDAMERLLADLQAA